MHAFVQRLRCGDHLIVRAGPLAKAYGDPYERACIGEIDGEAVTLLGFESPLGTLPMAVFRAAVRALMADGFTKVDLDRLSDSPHGLSFTKTEEGKITMSKHPHPDHAKKADGSYDLIAGKAGIDHWVNLIATGKLVTKPHGIQQVISPDGDLAFTYHGKLAKDAM